MSSLLIDGRINRLSDWLVNGRTGLSDDRQADMPTGKQVCQVTK